MFGIMSLSRRAIKAETLVSSIEWTCVCVGGLDQGLAAKAISGRDHRSKGEMVTPNEDRQLRVTL
jgi:hypothetical protein